MRRPSKILTTRILPSSVTELVIERPSGFTFRAGDFIFLLIPALPRFEWHPFGISSPPELQESSSLHVRTLGDYTKARRITHASPGPEIERGVIEPTSDISPRLSRRLTACLGQVPVYIDGPYGAPGQ